MADNGEVKKENGGGYDGGGGGGGGGDGGFSKKRAFDHEGGGSESSAAKRPHDNDGRSHSHRDRRGNDEGDRCFKFMVSNKDAGTIIGRGGSTIASLQNKSGARIKVSNSNEYFPGTQERVVLILGSVPQVVSGCTAVLYELFRDSESSGGRLPKEEAEKGAIHHKLLVPEISCGQVIGKGGENINKMVSESGAKMQLTAKEKQAPGSGERMLGVIGTSSLSLSLSLSLARSLRERERSERILGVIGT